jgi:maltose O-acetyltransferase
MSDGDGRSQLERMRAGDLYLADDPEIAAMGARARRLCALFNRAGADEDADRREILGQLLGVLGPETEVRPPFSCDFGSNISMGARCFANFGLVVLDVAPVTIGDDVQIGPNVQILTPTHPLDAELRRAKWEAAEPIAIGDNVWLGGGAIVLPGVSIGADTVIGAGAVVTRDVPANVVAVGNPARVIRTL